MRTSNKILAGTFIIALLIITGIHIGLYAKYKSNNFTTVQSLHEERYDSKSLKGIQSVVLTGLQNVTIIPSDTPHTEIAKRGDRNLSYEFANGVLTIKGDTTVKDNNDHTVRLKNWRDVIIYLPLNQNIKADDCSLTVKGLIDSTKNLSVQLALEATDLQLGSTELPYVMGIGNFNSVNIIVANGGNINIVPGALIKNMEINLDATQFSDGGASIDSLMVSTDHHSTISLTGKNISKTKFISKP